VTVARSSSPAMARETDEQPSLNIYNRVTAL